MKLANGADIERAKTEYSHALELQITRMMADIIQTKCQNYEYYFENKKLTHQCKL